MSSLRKLAERLDLSHATVSAALRGGQSVKSSTRERVLRAAEEIGYRSNPLASALMSEMRRSRAGIFRGVIAFLHLDGPADLSTGPGAGHRQLVAGAAARAARLGFKTDDIFPGRPGCEWERLNDVIAARGVDGVLVLPTTHPAGLGLIDWSRLPGVQLGFSAATPGLNAVRPDHHGSISTALNQLRALGYERPGLVLDSRHSSTEAALSNEAAFHSFFFGGPRRTRVTVPPSFFLSADENSEEAFHDWRQLGAHDVVLSDSTLPLTWLRRASLDVPAAIGFCHLDLGSASAACAGLNLNLDSVGHKGVDLLADQILRNERSVTDLPTITLCQASWVSGPTLRTQPAWAGERVSVFSAS